MQTPVNRYNLQRVRLNAGGYDTQGCYWGIGIPLWWFSNQDGSIDGRMRAINRSKAKEQIKKVDPTAKFFR